MKNRFTAVTIGIFTLALGSLLMHAKEPAAMVVNGREVPLSEFEYLYFKNQAQTQMQQLDEYVEIFKLYKLKVADALSLGLDTTQAFRDEYEQYRNDLALPYLTDSTYIRQLVDEAYEYYQTQVHPHHIMLAKTTNPVENRALINRLDSLRRLIVSGESDFAEIARQYSQDRASQSNGGDLGWTNNQYYPYAFLRSIYSLKIGEVSQIVESPVAYHLIKVTGQRPNKGYLSASHIFIRLGNTPAQQVGAQTLIDSLYSIVKADPEKFEETAVRHSDDKGSAYRGGKLDPFLQGHYPQPFDSIAFNMKDGEISAPFMTPFGWHIVKRFGMRPLETADAMEDQLTKIVTNPRDIRAEMISNRQLQKLSKEFGLKPVKKNLDIVNAYIATNGIDSLFLTNIKARLGNAPLYTYKGGTLTIADLTPQLQLLENLDPEFAAAEFQQRTNTLLRNKLIPLKEIALERTNADFRNLLNEFRDGSLLYEAGRLRVWDRAATDTVGLQQYFNDHRTDYKWQQPRAKGFLIQTQNDSIQNLVKARIETLSPNQYIPVLRQEFGNQIQIDRVLAQKGVSSMVDFLAFGAPEAKPANSRFTCYFIADLKILEAPEEMTDVRGLVITDYQNLLMQQWEDSLKNRFPITINPKALKKVKTK